MSMSDENTISESKLSEAKAEAYKQLNTIIELTQLLTERFWKDVEIKDRFVFAALSGGANSTARQLMDLIEDSEMN